MRKSYYVMHKFVTLCEQVITLCGNYYIMRKLLRYAASHTIIDIRQTALKLKPVTKYMPAVHALTGCDTVRYLFDIASERPQPWRYWWVDITSSKPVNREQRKIIWQLRQLPSLLPVMEPKLKNIIMTSHRYQMRKSKIVDPVQYGWHAGDDGTTVYPTTLTVGVSAAPLTILHLWSSVMFNVPQLQCWIKLL